MNHCKRAFSVLVLPLQRLYTLVPLSHTPILPKMFLSTFNLNNKTDSMNKVTNFHYVEKSCFCGKWFPS